MSDNTQIEWADATVNAINGCTRVSPGCGGPGDHGGCYAERLAATRLRDHPSRPGLATMTSKGPRWTGKVHLHELALLQPLSWTKPRRIFWNAHGDTFHDAVPNEWIDRIFAVAALTPQHTHMILTKRSKRMREYMTDNSTQRCDGRGSALIELWNRLETPFEDRCMDGSPWPPKNVWLGVSVEDQTRADERIPDLLATPAAVRFLSCEPLLGPVDLGKVFAIRDSDGVYLHDAPILDVDWVIAGGESGPGARPMHPDWARSLRDQCAAAGVPFHFKQWGEWRDQGRDVPIPRRNNQSHICHLDKDSGKCKPNPNRFSDETMIKLGKGKSGRLLDGVEHNGMPGGEK